MIIDSIQDIKGRNIVKLDLRQLDDAPAEYFIICEGESNTQVKSISENISKRLKFETNTLPFSKEGVSSSRWILLDYFSTVVHIFYKDVRSHYGLEDLWGDAEITEYADFDV